MSDAKEAPAAPKAADGGGIKAMLPLIVNLVAMPAIAFALTQFVLVPKLRAPAPAAEHAEEGAEGHGAEAAEGHGEAASESGEKKDAHGGGEHGEKKDAHGGGKVSKAPVPLSSKILVNVAGTMGTRYLQANISLAGKAGLKEAIEKFDAQLRDAAAGALASKTIADLEKPGARNLIRTELLGVFNTILGNGSVSELYLTDFAIQ